MDIGAELVMLLLMVELLSSKNEWNIKDFHTDESNEFVIILLVKFNVLPQIPIDSLQIACS